MKLSVFHSRLNGANGLSLTIFLNFSPWKTYHVSANRLDSILSLPGYALILYSVMVRDSESRRPVIYLVTGILWLLMSLPLWWIGKSLNLLVILSNDTLEKGKNDLL